STRRWLSGLQTICLQRSCGRWRAAADTALIAIGGLWASARTRCCWEPHPSTPSPSLRPTPKSYTS
ncbi:hypothetical protein M9458_022681, partial [Cirrhinus mrigala]